MSEAPFPFEADAVAWPTVIPEPSIDDSVVDWLEQRTITAQQLRTTWSSWNKKSRRKLYEDHQPRPLYFGFSAERPVGKQRIASNRHCLKTIRLPYGLLYSQPGLWLRMKAQV